jgi:hypothetical protein
MFALKYLDAPLTGWFVTYSAAIDISKMTRRANPFLFFIKNSPKIWLIINLKDDYKRVTSNRYITIWQPISAIICAKTVED